MVNLYHYIFLVLKRESFNDGEVDWCLRDKVNSRVLRSPGSWKIQWNIVCYGSN